MEGKQWTNPWSHQVAATEQSLGLEAIPIPRVYSRLRGSALEWTIAWPHQFGALTILVAYNKTVNRHKNANKSLDRGAGSVSVNNETSHEMRRYKE
jgi:hypothetical protein